MSDTSQTTNLVTALLSGGGVLVLREIVGGFLKMRGGIAATETKRKADLVAERRDAEERMRLAEERHEDERALRWQAENYSAKLTQLLTLHGIEVPTPPERQRATVDPPTP